MQANPTSRDHHQTSANAGYRFQGNLALPGIEYAQAQVRRHGLQETHTWTLERPVLRGEASSEKPLWMFSRVSEYLAEVVKADASYNGVLSHNPMVSGPGQNLRTLWLRQEPYPLVALAEVIPFGRRAPAVPKTAIGRHEAMFRTLLKWAGSSDNLGVAVLTAAMSIYRDILEEFPNADHAFAVSEVQGIARSVERYRARRKKAAAKGPVSHFLGVRHEGP